ncbi:DNA sulfur modification protein DndB [Streptomyces sp. NPDC050636]|uniref:DNA sulfur modification protein DndB n=1 Tax=Streptomyces sp. NPDC050636 TaxID=3154510 RepID=UPI003422263B
MGRPENQIGLEGDAALRSLALWLRAQRQRADLTYQQMAEVTEYTHSTLSRAANGRRVPRLEVVDAYARACDADVSEARRLWRKARQASVHALPGAPDTAAMRPEYVSNFAELHTAMTGVHRSAGMPSLRELARRAGNHGELPRSTLHSILRQQAIPSRQHLLAFVKACGVSGQATQEWASAWDRASRRHTRWTTAATFRSALPWRTPVQGGAYDTVDEATMTRLIAMRSLPFKGHIETERSILSARSRKLFTLSALYYGNLALMKGIKVDGDQYLQLATLYWNAVDTIIPEWAMVRNRAMFAPEVRRDYVHSHGIAIHCLGSIGNALLQRSPDPEKWEPYLQRLALVDWARSNPDWEGRALVGGRISKSHQNVILTGNYLRQRIGLPLSRAEREVESSFLRSALQPDGYAPSPGITARRGPLQVT